ncbi:FMN-binding protein [Microbacterium jejuense]|uniref:FMN-binding protein n=1 Tax=Microbacterium jejuense TaxID=1263637 RepID=UPI0031EEC00F
MKKIVYAVLATVSGLVLLFSYRTSHVEQMTPVAADTSSSGSASTGTSGSATPGATDSGSTDSGTTDSGAADSGSTGSGATGSGAADAGSGAASASSSGLVDGTYTGSAADTRFGPVQVQITVSGGAITDVQVPEYPSTNPRDRQINTRALPTLIAETTQAQSADIDMVSGATYTSEGYLTSLQSALDQARS